MMTRPRCERCRNPTATRSTMAGELCKRCASRLPGHLRRDPAQPKPNASRTIRPAKQGGLWTTRAAEPVTAKAARRALKGK
jgi:hypothetical protein